MSKTIYLHIYDHGSRYSHIEYYYEGPYELVKYSAGGIVYKDSTGRTPVVRFKEFKNDYQSVEVVYQEDLGAVFEKRCEYTGEVQETLIKVGQGWCYTHFLGRYNSDPMDPDKAVDYLIKNKYKRIK